MMVDAILGAPRQGGLPGTVNGSCECGAGIMWSDRCPATARKLCVECVTRLVIGKPGALIGTPSGIGLIRTSHLRAADSSAKARPTKPRTNRKSDNAQREK